MSKIYNIQLTRSDQEKLLAMVIDTLYTDNFLYHGTDKDLYINRNHLCEMEKMLEENHTDQIMLTSLDLELLKNVIINILFNAYYDWYPTVYNFSKKSVIDILCVLNNESDDILRYDQSYWKRK